MTLVQELYVILSVNMLHYNTEKTFLLAQISTDTMYEGPTI